MGEYLERVSLNWSENSVRLIETASLKAKEYFFYIQEAGYFETTYPYFTERKNLSSFLIVYTIAGKGNLHYKGERYELTKNHIFFIDCMEHHYYECSKTDPWEILWIHFNGNNAKGYYQEFIHNGFQILEPKDSFPIESALRRIVSLHKRKDRHRELLTSNLVTSVLTDIIMETTPEHHFEHFMPDYIKKVKRKLDKDYQTALSLDSLAKEFGVSKFYLAKEFKRSVGIPVNEYLILLRIDKAKEKLKYSELTVAEIAMNVGVMNISHFINLFKTREGMTPLRFRKEWR